MLASFQRNFVHPTMLVLFLSINGVTQSTLNQEKRLPIKPDQVKSAEQRIDQITQDSGRYFKQGLYNLLSRRGTEARQDFDKSVEVFLMSGVNVQRVQKLRECYNQLLETVFRIEFSANTEQANLRSLSTVCGWDIKDELADNIAKLLQNRTAVKVSKVTNQSVGTNSANDQELNAGFSTQKFEPSPADELSRSRLGNATVRPITKGPGPRPQQRANGTVPLVITFIDETFDDPYSVKYLKLTPLEKEVIQERSFWSTSLKLRAKNLYNAYRLATMYFYISDGKIIYASENKIASRPLVSTPIRELKSTPSPTGSKPTKIVRAQTGDTIEQLAKRYGVSPIEVAKLNGLLTTSRLNDGRVIRIPTNSSNPISNTWEDISRRTGVSVYDLRRANPGMVRPTGRIMVPDN